MTTGIPAPDNRALVEAELARIGQVLAGDTGPGADAARRLLSATTKMLAFPTLTRDLVSSNQVSDWLHAEAAKVLAGEL